jgi:hypothetical protein
MKAFVAPPPTTTTTTTIITITATNCFYLLGHIVLFATHTVYVFDLYVFLIRCFCYLILIFFNPRAEKNWAWLLNSGGLTQG